jgi:hypothetical protein
MKNALDCVINSPDPEVFNQITKVIRSWTQDHLTSVAMLQYAFKVAGIQTLDSVLFLDERLPRQADYLSVMTLISLKQLVGSRCHVPWKPDYLYGEWRGDSKSLYGLGFGYARILGQGDLSDMEKQFSVHPYPGLQDLDFDSYDLIVVGSACRNRKLTNMVSALNGPNRLYFVGEDYPLSRSERMWLRSLNGSVFVREIY